MMFSYASQLSIPLIDHFSLQEQLEALDKLEKLNNEYSANLYELMMRTEKVIFHSPNYKMPDDVFSLFTDIKNLESSIPSKRTKLLQTASEIQDYENMLKLLTQIMDAAANNLLIFPVTVSSLPHLQVSILNFYSTHLT